MYLFVIKIAIAVNNDAELVIIIPALGFNTANVLELFVETGPNKSSVTYKNTFFFFEDFYFVLLESLSF